MKRKTTYNHGYRLMNRVSPEAKRVARDIAKRLQLGAPAEWINQYEIQVNWMKLKNIIATADVREAEAERVADRLRAFTPAFNQEILKERQAEIEKASIDLAGAYGVLDRDFRKKLGMKVPKFKALDMLNALKGNSSNPSFFSFGDAVDENLSPEEKEAKRVADALTGEGDFKWAEMPYKDMGIVIPGRPGVGKSDMVIALSYQMLANSKSHKVWESKAST